MNKAWGKLSIMREARAAMENTKHIYIDLQQEQMMNGEASDGMPIGKYNSEPYAEMKFKEYSKLAGFGMADLKLTGDFQRGLKLVTQSNTKYRVYSSDKKASKLMAMYGGDRIYYLNQKYISEYRKDFMPELQDRVRDFIKKA